VYRFIFAAKQKTPETERVFRQSVESFRRMSLTEIEGAKPLRLKVVSVAPGDTVEKFATQMAVVDRPAERFRVLNGLAASEQVKAGDQVKIVIE
jgi:predicted Zn-dependent protease